MAFLTYSKVNRDHKELYELVHSILGFIPNSMLLMAEREEVLYAFSVLTSAIINPPVKLSKFKMVLIMIKLVVAVLKSKAERDQQISIDLKWMVANIASKAAGCNYCQNHTFHSATKYGLSEEKAEKIFEYKTSDLFTEAERAALDLAMAAGSNPNYSNKEHFVELDKHFTKKEIIDIVSVISLFGFLNRWNDTLNTDLEPIFDKK